MGEIGMRRGGSRFRHCLLKFSGRAERYSKGASITPQSV